MPRDYYAILGIASDASQETIRRAFRQKARRLHPDVNRSPDALIHFQELQNAYEILKDPARREQYDQSEPLPEIQQAAPARASYSQGTAWNSHSRFDPEFGYVDTDYAHYSRLTTIVGIITLLFATTFLVDYLFANEYYSQRVISVQNKGLLTRKTDDLDLVLVQTAEGTFEKTAGEPELVPGEMIDIRSSLIYGFFRFKRSTETSFRKTTTLSMITYTLAIIVYVAALNAILNKKHQERKFNAAIIAAFFSIVLLVFALIS